MLKELAHKIGCQIASGGRFFMSTAKWPFRCCSVLIVRQRGAADRRLKTAGGRVGVAGEKLAERHLKKLGYRILARGHRQRRGEIDLVALDGRCIVFVEVKSRTQADSGLQAVDRGKQEKLTRAALVYLKEKRLLESPTRFDVISVEYVDGAKPQLQHIKHAFQATGPGSMFS